MKRALAVLSGTLISAFTSRAAVADNIPTVTNVTATANQWKSKAIDFLIQHGPALLGAVTMVVVGWMVGTWVRKLLDAKLEKRQMEPPVRLLIGRVVHVLILGFTFIIALDTVGFKMTTLIAGISVAGVGIGLAMQGMLGNFFAGLLIIFTKPFRIGEYIEIVGVNGQVETIELFSTMLVHADRSRVIIPNRKIIGEILHNYGKIRQLDLSVAISYSANIPETLSLVKDILRENKRVMKDISPGLGVTMLADSSIIIAIKPFVSIQDYGAAGPELYQEIVERFRSKSIEIPYPQREIRVLNGNGSKVGI
ncbi:MAG TPA: mechanosensitive ion channel family protein [Candidatus Saccharimonadales bacterium]|nr:mechanosensitive ion channel family protein [Candidatus Saccharimonadales bacterium]